MWFKPNSIESGNKLGRGKLLVRGISFNCWTTACHLAAAIFIYSSHGFNETWPLRLLSIQRHLIALHPIRKWKRGKGAMTPLNACGHKNFLICRDIAIANTGKLTWFKGFRGFCYPKEMELGCQPVDLFVSLFSGSSSTRRSKVTGWSEAHIIVYF